MPVALALVEVAGSALVEEAEVDAFALACASHDGNFGVVALCSTVAATGRALGAVAVARSTSAAMGRAEAALALLAALGGAAGLGGGVAARFGLGSKGSSLTLRCFGGGWSGERGCNVVDVPLAFGGGCKGDRGLAFGTRLVSSVYCGDCSSSSRYLAAAAVAA